MGNPQVGNWKMSKHDWYDSKTVIGSFCPNCRIHVCRDSIAYSNIYDSECLADKPKKMDEGWKKKLMVDDTFKKANELKDSMVSDFAKRGIEGELPESLVNGLARSHAVASRIAMDTVLFGRVRPLSERLAGIQSVTPEDVQRVAREYLVDTGLSIVRVIPPPPEGRSG